MRARFDSVESNLNDVHKTQTEVVAMLGAGLEVLFESQTGERPEKTAKELNKVWSSRVLRRLKKKAGTQIGAGK